VSRSARQALFLAVLYGLLSFGVRAQDAPATQEQADAAQEVLGREAAGPQAVDGESADLEVSDPGGAAPALSSGKKEPTVVLSPWRVGGVRDEKRKEESRRRKERVLRESEQKKRVLRRRKKRARERAEKVKRETNPLYPTYY